MNFRGLQIVIFCYSCIPTALGKGDGAPESACDSMTPSHSGYTFQDPKTLPYSISVEPGCSTVIIQGTEIFKGFLLKAVNERNETIGKFLKNNERTKLICGDQAVTHTERLTVSQIGLRWDSDGFLGTVYFQGTIVKDFSNFWSIRSSSCDTRTIPTTTETTAIYALTSFLSPKLLDCADCNTSISSTKTTTIYYDVGTPLITPTPVSSDIQSQQSCPPNVKCFQCPDSNCVITWAKGARDYVDFQISAYVRSDNRYVAMAFSYDEEMGNDSVVLCWKEGNKHFAEVWFTGEESISKTPDPLESLDVSKTKFSYEDKWMSCKFSKRIERSINSSGEVYYLNESTYNLFFATGMMSSGGPRKHERKAFSTSKFNFTDFRVEANIATQSDIRYQESCPVNEGCFTCPNGKCVINWSPKNNDYETFQISAPVVDDTSYLAMALSKDEKMGNDSITICYKFGDSFVAKMWYSVDYKVYPASNPFESLDPSSFNGSYSNGRMSCRFSKQIERPQGSNNSVYYLNDQLFHLLFATGPMNGEVPEKHVYKLFSNSALNLTDISTVNVGDPPSSNSLIKAHGILMVIAWLMMASVSILLPRYFKSAWPDKKILNKPIWFPIHQILMVFVFLLTAIAFIIIFCEVRGYVQDDDGPTTRAHAPIGIIVMILVVLNPVMALVRCNPEHKYRWIFNYFHTFVGEFALILAVINIFLSFFMPQANIGYWVVWVMVALVCWHALIEFLLVMHQKYLQSKSFRSTGDTLSSEIKLHNFMSTSSKLLSSLQTFLIFAQWIGVTGLAIAICVGIGIA